MLTPGLIIAREQNVVRVDFRGKPERPIRPFPGASGLRPASSSNGPVENSDANIRIADRLIKSHSVRKIKRGDV